MATLAKRLITVEEFLDIEFPTDTRFELDNGVIKMMAGGLAVHARIRGNVFGALFVKLRGTGCSPFGPDMGVRTHDLSLRYPDVSVFCGRDGPENDKLKSFDDPKLVVEVLSPTTRQDDTKIKLPEYRAIPSLDAILYIDPEDETAHLETRDTARGWVITVLESGGSLTLPLHGIALSWDEIFARAA
ncbi:MAG: Uma2 family endonuclease [Sphingomonadaceae bacterium]